MPHGNAQGAAQAANLAEQQERSKVGMRSGSKVPTSKSKSGFNGYGGDAPLTTTGATQSAGVRGSVGGKGPNEPLHPWLEYPPNFTRSVTSKAAFVAKVCSPITNFDPLPAELKYTLTRNFGFFTKIFTLPFDKDGVKTVQQSVGLSK
jgi:hypothetical protein|tara:strand:+ start:5979 stop:6422 length:444 start_codon:yes stop_codon:yes gene_type:complete|mmetsp:Transcript_9042/g.33712  ORF Transcript_9042/g.33712 Transcript_9042/m.33712 type:complete len:148 (-) Transcript_9042:85-528(-)